MLRCLLQSQSVLSVSTDPILIYREKSVVVFRNKVFQVTRLEAYSPSFADFVIKKVQFETELIPNKDMILNTVQVWYHGKLLTRQI